MTARNIYSIQEGKGKSKDKRGFVYCIAPCREHTSEVWHVFSRDLTVSPAHPTFIG